MKVGFFMSDVRTDNSGSRTGLLHFEIHYDPGGWKPGGGLLWPDSLDLVGGWIGCDDVR